MKECDKCKEVKPFSEYAANKRRVDGMQNNCKACQKAYKAAHYQANKDRVKGGVKARKQAVAGQLWAYKQDKSCLDCGNTNPIVFEFDHLGDKEFNISHMVGAGYSWESILTEIAKCEIVCANCHRVRTASRAGWYNYGPLV